MKHGKVPMFKMRPSVGPLIGAVVVLLFGGAVYWSAIQDPTKIEAQQASQLVLAVSVVIAGGLVIIATGRMWFRHLWHDRYKK